MIILDTNLIIRLFTQDNQSQAKKVIKLLETEKELFIPEVVFPEIEYVLSLVYKFNRYAISYYLKSLIALDNIKITQEIAIAIRIYDESNLDMADCLIAAHARGKIIASFDTKLVKASQAHSYW